LPPPQEENEKAAPTLRHRLVTRPTQGEGTRFSFLAALSRLAVDLAFGHLGQFLVGRLLLIQRLIEERGGIVAARVFS
jgi:hypothetical protein